MSLTLSLTLLTLTLTLTLLTLTWTLTLLTLALLTLFRLYFYFLASGCIFGFWLLAVFQAFSPRLYWPGPAPAVFQAFAPRLDFGLLAPVGLLEQGKKNQNLKGIVKNH